MGVARHSPPAMDSVTDAAVRRNPTAVSNGDRNASMFPVCVRDRACTARAKRSHSRRFPLYTDGIMKRRLSPLLLVATIAIAASAAAYTAFRLSPTLQDAVIERGARSGRRPRDHRLVLDGIFWIARTGVAWRDLHEHFGKWSSIYRQFRRWTLSGLWELLLEAFNESGGGNPSLQMINTIKGIKM